MTGLTDHVRSLDSAELPSYVYDLAALRTHAAAVRQALPERVEMYYAAKANPEPEILAALAPYVDGFEVSSGGELAHVAEAVRDRPLAFGGPGKTPDEITAVLHHPDGLIWRTAPDNAVAGGPELVQELWHPIRSLLRRPTAPV